MFARKKIMVMYFLEGLEMKNGWELGNWMMVDEISRKVDRQ